MRRSILVVLIVVLAAACSPRAEFRMVPEAARDAGQSGAPESAEVPVFVGTTRAPDPETGEPFSWKRAPRLRYARFDVEVPRDRAPGEIPVPARGRPADPERHFVLGDAQVYPAAPAFRASLSKALAARGGEAVIYVHGFNNTMAEGVYRMAQLAHDLQLPGVFVHYAWPSRAHVMGYAYDRDSMMVSRDGFEGLLRELRAAGARRVVILAHSMGSALTMEVLRQISLQGDDALLRRISGVVLISPDLDVDLFRSQALRAGWLPKPFVIFTSQRDRALQLASRLSGEGERLGNLSDVERVADLPVTVVEVGAYSSGDGHFTPGNSPALLALLKHGGELNAALATEASGRTGLVPGVVLTVRDATRIVLSPVGGMVGLTP